jgi:hypothetical protein
MGGLVGLEHESRRSAHAEGMHGGGANGARGAVHDVSRLGAPEASWRATRTIRRCAQRGQRSTSRPVSASMHSSQVCGCLESSLTVATGRSQLPVGGVAEFVAGVPRVLRRVAIVPWAM